MKDELHDTDTELEQSQTDLVIAAAKNVDIDYGDFISRATIKSMLHIEPVEIHAGMNPAEVRKAMDDESWEFLALMELFKAAMREHRHMQLVALRKMGIYKVLRPEEHAAEALATLQKQIKKGFKQAKDLLDATAVDMLDEVQKTELTEAKVHTARLKDLVGRTSAKTKIEESLVTGISN